MNRLFSLLMAAFLCCSLQNLNAESAGQVEGMASDSSAKFNSEFQGEFKDALQGVLGQMEMNVRDSGGCSATDVASSVAVSGLSCAISQVSIPSVLATVIDPVISTVIGHSPTSQDCVGTITTLTQKCCDGEKMSVCLPAVQKVFVDIPGDLTSKLSSLTAVCQKCRDSSLCPHQVADACFAFVNGVSGKLTSLPLIAFQYGCTSSTCTDFTLARMCAYFSKDAGSIGNCWSAGSISSNANSDVIAYIKGAAGNLAGANPYPDAGRLNMIRVSPWANPAACYAKPDDCKAAIANNGTCCCQYAKECCKEGSTCAEAWKDTNCSSCDMPK